ncbi:hypothetical protein ASE52_02550 [Acidovorax sp. Root275]|nr:hypothetical protein ASE52_02550 [Acidovorax sp. Root275]
MVRRISGLATSDLMAAVVVLMRMTWHGPARYACGGRLGALTGSPRQDVGMAAREGRDGFIGFVPGVGRRLGVGLRNGQCHRRVSQLGRRCRGICSVSPDDQTACLIGGLGQRGQG